MRQGTISVHSSASRQRYTRFRGSYTRKTFNSRVLCSTRSFAEGPGKPWPFEKENPRILVPAGSFQMGSEKGESDEQPVKTVQLSPYHLAKTPITVGQYRRFLEDSEGVQLRAFLSDRDMFGVERIIAKPGETKDALVERAREVFGRRIEGMQIVLAKLPNFAANQKGDHFPVVGLFWEEARAFCRHYGADLMTAAQYERAAKGKTGKDEFGTPVDGAIINDNGFRSTQEVLGKEVAKRVNDFGFLDLAGNIEEWTRDRFEEDWYQRMPEQDPHNPLTDIYEQAAETRGGSWFQICWGARAACRDDLDPVDRFDVVGFRPAWPQDS